MKKKQIRLTESQLINMVKNTVSKVLNESSPIDVYSQEPEPEVGVQDMVNKEIEEATVHISSAFEALSIAVRYIKDPDEVEKINKIVAALKKVKTVLEKQ